MKRSRALPFKLLQASKVTAQLCRKVKRALRATSIPEARWYNSGRIKNLAHVNAGWEAKSWLDKTVTIELWKSQTEWPQIVTNALVGFNVEHEENDGIHQWVVKLPVDVAQPLRADDNRK